MFGIGSQELLIIFGIIIVILTMILPLRFQKWHPNKMWLGFLFTLLNPPFAQFYVPGGLKYFLILLGLCLLNVIKVSYYISVLGLIAMYALGIFFIQRRISKEKTSTGFRKG